MRLLSLSLSLSHKVHFLVEQNDNMNLTRNFGRNNDSEINDCELRICVLRQHLHQTQTQIGLSKQFNFCCIFTNLSLSLSLSQGSIPSGVARNCLHQNMRTKYQREREREREITYPCNFQSFNFSNNVFQLIVIKSAKI